MIISASRRTDIPAFYARWIINRIRAGYCTVANPFNQKQVSYISLRPEDVDLIVFWTRNPQPLFPGLDELNRCGFRYYFLFTLMDNPSILDPKMPALVSSLNAFQELAKLIGPEKVVWRYDPIVFSNITDVEFHIQKYKHIAESLAGYTKRSIISIVDIYRKLKKRVDKMNEQGIEIIDDKAKLGKHIEDLMGNLKDIAARNEMEIFSCSEILDLQRFGINPGKCIDDNFIKEVFGLNVPHQKDKSQRKACGCVLSKDIGYYDTCLYNCQYCYATSSLDRAKMRHKLHNPKSPSLIGWQDV